ncbi:site-specific integrase [Enterovibrio sp. ZSDZ42]|uniref:Site-specific integrase n=1 Tax=Enterovibrio gelatinilyticus TaxID=2899819 RepID=A0ABT5QUA0_9GAMM|nr:site-specific integrase [Enterovibrio sp. ZSDZ42]MDD1791520.1 site-specific integrase [Enterovibrio sp. ZSDZ42]
MASITVRSGKLRLDFRVHGERCREQTVLHDTETNRRKLTKLLASIDADMRLGCFVYRDYFPDSKRANKFYRLDNAAAKRKQEISHHYIATHSQLTACDNVTFRAFADEWFEENKPRWKQSYYETITIILNRYLLPTFGEHLIANVTRADILKFRALLSQRDRSLSNDYINHIMTPLRMILSEAADRYEFRTPFENIKALRLNKRDVNPFSLQEVTHFLKHIRKDFLPYYTVRFFTGMRTAEIDGLKWRYVNFDSGYIRIRETLVNGRPETAKTDGSVREIQMSQVVRQAFLEQKRINTDKSEYVFCTKSGTPLDHRNLRDRIWKPALNQMGFDYRRPYETRHTAATLWLAAGEAPEWIARQMGHANTKMLFEVYSRFVPNLTRQDGSAFEALLSKHIQGDTL